MSTDCEALLKKFLALNPAKRYTLEQIMKDKWMNANEEELKPYVEPSVEMNDPKTIESLLTLGYKLNDIEKSLSSRRFDEIFGTYLLLQNSNNGNNRKLSRSKPDSMTSIASSTIASSAAPSSSTMPSTNSVPSSTINHHHNNNANNTNNLIHPKSETTTNVEGLKETSFMTMTLEDNSTTKTAKHTNNDPPSPEPTTLKRQHTIGAESLKERNAIRLHSVSSGNPNLRPISATPKAIGERSLQKSPVKPLRAFKPETSLSTTAQTPRRPNVYKKVENSKDSSVTSSSTVTPTVTTTSLLTPSSTVGNSSSSTSGNFTRNGPSRYTFHSGQSRSVGGREHNTLGSKVEPSFGKGNFLQRLTTRFSKRFRLNGKHPGAANTTNTTDSSNSK